MKVLPLEQGTQAWKDARAQYDCASDAPAMMGASKWMTRSEYLRQRATGDVPTVDPIKQELFDRGHAAERAVRALVEADLGEDLYPSVVTDDAGRMLASLDGVTMEGSTGIEVKLWNEDLAAQVRAGELPPGYYWQLEHQALVAGLQRILFVCSDGTRERWAQMEYRPVPGRAEQLLAGWAQLHADLDAYQRVESTVSPAGAPVLDLPAVSVQVTGQLVVADNFKAFETALRDFIDNRLIRSPQTDQDFADLDTQIKALKKAEAALESAETAMLAQVSSIDAMKRTKDMLYDLARTNRLMAEKLLEAEKANRRNEIQQAGVTAFLSHVSGLTERLGKPYMPSIPVDFAGAMRGKKTIASLKDAVSTELARAKIAANAEADKIQINLNYLREHAQDYAFLFADTAQLVLKPIEDFPVLVRLRISDHKANEAKREEEQRERIRAEEQAKTPPAPTPTVVPQRATTGMSDDERLAMAHEEIDLLIKNFGHLKALATPMAALRAYRNGTRKRRTA